MQQAPYKLKEKFAEDGFVFPLRAMSEAAAAEYRRRFEDAEALAAGRGIPDSALRHDGNAVLPFLDEITRLPALTDPVAAILGEDLLVWGCTMFLKEPETPSYISWHQDLHYWGLDGDEDQVTAWLALSPATAESGCMRFVAGSHRRVVEHVDTFETNNLLTRGQEIAVEVDEADAVDVQLRPGEMSLHHGRAFHASNPNRSSDRRIGLAIRYIATRMRRAVGDRTAAMLVRGRDRYGHFETARRPSGLLTEQDLARQKRATDIKKAILYRETKAA